jgi:hypothetical protein
VDFVATDQVVLRTTALGPAVLTFSVPWSDGVARTYRLDYDGTSVITFYVDNVAQSPTTTQSAFSSSAVVGTQIQATPVTGSSFEATLGSLVSGHVLGTTAGLGRTFGIWLGGAYTDIDNWKIPRSDGTTAPNSDATMATVVPMDWRSECWVRVFLDPTYGVSFIRPDLAPPPGYVGDFATQSMNPSAGWTTVEYARLPRVSPSERFGTVRFGKLNPSSSAITRWGDIRYRVFSHTSTDYRAPQGMVLNRWNVITSGDWLKDSTPERVLVASATLTRVSLRPCGINADRVFSVSVDGSITDPAFWSFNRTTQDIILSRALPAVGYPVEVVFAPGRPVTQAYLQGQPLAESQTILNEGTPPVPRSQVGRGTITTISGSGGATPAFPPAGPSDPHYFLQDPYLTRQYQNPTEESTRYDRMSFFELEDDGVRGNLAGLTDHGAPYAMGISGSVFSEIIQRPGMPSLGPWGTVLHASGGTTELLGVIGPAVYAGQFSNPDAPITGLLPSMTFPLGTSAGVVPGSVSMGGSQEILWVLQLGVVPGSAVSDPDFMDGIPSPEDVAPTYELIELAEFSRVGPWTGYEEDLVRVSLLYGASDLQPTGEPASGRGFVALGGAPLPDAPVPVVGTL